MARNKRGDEALIAMLCDDARLAVGGTPKARENRKKKSRGKLHREMLMEAVCGCGGIAVVSVPVPKAGGGIRHKKKCRACAGVAPTGTLGHREPVQSVPFIPKVKRSGVRVFA